MERGLLGTWGTKTRKFEPGKEKKFSREKKKKSFPQRIKSVFVPQGPKNNIYINMAQLKVKQISDFVTAVGGIHDATVGAAAVTAISTAKGEAIASAAADATSKANAAQSAAIASAAADATSKANAAQSAAIASAAADATSKANAAISAANGYTDDREIAIRADFASADTAIVTNYQLADAALETAINTEKARINALLLDSTTALDTFAEIEGFITSLETSDVSGLSTALSTAVSNDAVHAAGISANATAIANLDLGVDLSLTADATSNTVVNSKGTNAKLSGATGEDAGLMTAEDFRKLEGIEAGADVTDATSVQAAGALMDSEVDADIKTLSLPANTTISAFGKTLVDDADAAAVRTTLGLGTAATTAATAYATSAQGTKADSAVQNLGDLSIIATATELNQLDGVTLGNIVTYSASDFTAATSFNTLAGRVTTLEALDVVQQVGNFVDVKTFMLDKSVSTSDNNITVFINGLQIHEFVEGVTDGYTTANGKNFTLNNLGYNLEANDHVIVLGVLA